MDAAGQDGGAYPRRMSSTGFLPSSFGVPDGFEDGAKRGVYWSSNGFRDGEPQWASRSDTGRTSAGWSQSYVPRVVAGMVSATRLKQPPALAPCSCPSESYPSEVTNVIGSDGKVAATVYGSSHCLHVKLRRLDFLRRYFISLDMEVEGEDRQNDIDHYLMPEPNHLDGFQWFQFEFTINMATVFREWHGSSRGSVYQLSMRVIQLTDECWPAGPDPVLLSLKEGNCRDLCHSQRTSHEDPWAPQIPRRGPEGLDRFAQEIRKSFEAFSAAHSHRPPVQSRGLLQNLNCWDDTGSGMPRVAEASCHPSVCRCCFPCGHCNVGGRHLQSSRTTFFRDLDSEVELALTKVRLREINCPEGGCFGDSRHGEDPHEIYNDPSMASRNLR